MSITALPALDRTDPTFKAEVDVFFGTQLPLFSVEAEAARLEINSNLTLVNTATNTATTKALQASNSATAAGNSATAASISAGQAQGYASVATNYLSPKASDPSLNDQGGALTAGLLYYNTTTGTTRVYTGSIWKDSGSSVNGVLSKYTYTATAGQTTFTAVYDVGFADVYVNGIRLDTSDFTASSGTNIILSVPAALNDLINIVSFGAFSVANTYTKAETNALITNATIQLSTLHAIALSL